jgi:antibiotic biosynthesis monooxygenase (ABM) superfamily enzyme
VSRTFFVDNARRNFLCQWLGIAVRHKAVLYVLVLTFTFGAPDLVGHIDFFYRMLVCKEISV